MRREDADLLVCGSRGCGPARRVLLGGVSARLLRHARIPVMVVPRPWRRALISRRPARVAGPG